MKSILPMEHLQQLKARGKHALESPEFAQELDAADELAFLRSEFCMPNNSIVVPKAAEALGELDLEAECVYLAGNSLGLMPKSTREYISQELNVWASSGVMGHHQHPHPGRAWLQIDEIVTGTLANLLGAQQSEVACMGTLTSNLHQILTSFYRPTPQRHRILYEGKAFPSDQYAFASQVEMHNLSPSSLLPMNPLPGEFSIRTSEILKLIEEEGESIAVICFGAIQYYSGEWFEMEKITAAGHAKGCFVGFDLAHAIGNVPMSLHDWGVDFAVWCSYKYLCSGPGGIAGLFVHDKWSDRSRLAGWWGHSLETRFAMPNAFAPSPGAAGFMLSNPSVLDVISLFSSLEQFQKAGAISSSIPHYSAPKSPGSTMLTALRNKSIALTSYLESLLTASPQYLSLADFAAAPSDSLHFTIITPLEPLRRGAQLSILFSPPEKMESVFASLLRQGILADERKPGVIRLSPVPMYNAYEDVRKCGKGLKLAMEGATMGK